MLRCKVVSVTGSITELSEKSFHVTTWTQSASPRIEPVHASRSAALFPASQYTKALGLDCCESTGSINIFLYLECATAGLPSMASAPTTVAEPQSEKP